MSTKGQAKGDKNGFKRQKEAIESFAKSSEFKIVKYFREPVSGCKSEDERPAFREMDVQGLDKIGERVFNLQRAILLREGHKGREDDKLPESDHTVPLPSQPGLNPKNSLPGEKGGITYRVGTVVEREKFEKMKDEYYQLRGWDPQTGLLKKDTLQKLDLEDVIEPLKEKVL